MSDPDPQTTTYYAVAWENTCHQDCVWYSVAEQALVNQQRMEYEQGYSAWTYEFSRDVRSAENAD